MPYVRLSMHVPMAGQRDGVKALQQRILDHLRQAPGFKQGFLLVATGTSGAIGRLTIWESEEHADNAAQQSETMALRSQVAILANPDEEGVEHAFLAE